MLLALPLIILTAPGVTIDVPVSRAVETVEVTGRVSAPGPERPRLNTGESREFVDRRWQLPSWRLILRSAWIAGALSMLVWLAGAWWRLRRIRRHGLPSHEIRKLTQGLTAECGVRRPVEVLLHEDIPAPLTCGVWHPAIMLPTASRDWNEVDLRRALIHELEHVRRRDWIVQLAARAICAAYWFHLLVWMAWRRLGLEAERACDDAVVRDAERADYADQLVLLAQQMSYAHAHPALGMARRGDLSTRVSALLDANQRRGRVGLLAAAVAVSVASILVLAIAPVRAISRSNKSTVASQEPRSNSNSAPQQVSAIDRALFEAAASNDLSSIDRLLNAGANVNCAIGGDGSPLIGAARNGHLTTVRLLLDRGADPNMPVRGDGSPLIAAAREGHTDVVSLLLDRGANVNQVVTGDENALIQASGGGHLPVVKLLVSRDADVNSRVWVEGTGNSKGEWRTPLSMARKGGHKEVVDFLLFHGARDD